MDESLYPIRFVTQGGQHVLDKHLLPSTECEVHCETCSAQMGSACNSTGGKTLLHGQSSYCGATTVVGLEWTGWVEWYGAK